MNRPGFIETGTVAHCGDSLEGQFACSITCTDIQSGWTHNRAVWGKGATGVVEQTRDMEALLAFPLIAFWSDNGSEFLNGHLWRYRIFQAERSFHGDENHPGRVSRLPVLTVGGIVGNLQLGRCSSAGQSSGIIIRVSGVRVPAPLLGGMPALVRPP